MLTAFERLIQNIPRDASVMDVGYGGLDGENTTNFLRKHFGAIDGLCKDEYAVARYKALFPEAEANDQVYIGMYPQDMPQEKYDLLVLDMGIDHNLDFWSEEGMQRAWSFVNDGGSIITYIMLTDFYSTEETQKRIKAHRESFWASEMQKIVWHKVVDMAREERRPCIMFVHLKKDIYETMPRIA